MNYRFAGGLSLSLGLIAPACAQELEWKPAAQRPAAAPVRPAASGSGLIPVQALESVPAAPAQPTRAYPRADSPGTTAATPQKPSRLAAAFAPKPAAGKLVPISAVGMNADGTTWVKVKAQAEQGGEVEKILTIPAQADGPQPPPATPADGKPATPAADEKVAGKLPAAHAPGQLVMGTQPTGTGQYPVFLLTDDPQLFGDPYGQSSRFYAKAEYLLWWLKRDVAPPLLTTGPANQVGVPGALNTPGTTVLLGGNDLSSSFRQGGRFTVGGWLDDERECGFEASYFFTGSKGKDFFADGTQFPRLFRPFVAVNPGIAGEFSEQVFGQPGSTGSFAASQNSQFWGADVNYKPKLCCGCDYRADLIAGFRYLNLDESLTIIENNTRLTADPTSIPPFPAGTQRIAVDRFSTRNDFYGGQLGAAASYFRDKWSLDFRGTVALGTTHQRLSIDGFQVVQLPNGNTLTARGALLAEPSNIGDSSRNVFSVVPEVNVTVGYQLTSHLRATAGYNFLYWSNVIRPGHEIDRQIDVTQVPFFIPNGVNVPSAGRNSPARLFNDTDFWAQGANLGLEYRW